MPSDVSEGVKGSFMDVSVYGRLIKTDVQTLGYFPAERGVYHLVLVSGRPNLATVDTVPLKL